MLGTQGGNYRDIDAKYNMRHARDVVGGVVFSGFRNHCSAIPIKEKQSCTHLIMSVETP